MLRKIELLRRSASRPVCRENNKDTSRKLLPFLLCLLSSGFLILSFPRPSLWFFAWFGLVPLLFAIEGRGPQRAFLLSFFAGIIFFSGILYWLIHVTLLGLIFLVLYLALYFGIFGLIIGSLSTAGFKFPTLLFIPSLWVSLEYLRSHFLTGFGWALLGYSQYLNLPIIQIADITGAYGVSFLIVMVNVGIKELVGPTSHIQRRFSFLIPSLCLIATLAYGYYRLNLPPTSQHLSPIKISVIQGNIPQEEKSKLELKETIFKRYAQLTNLALKDEPDLVIWPETAIPGDLNEPGTFKSLSTLAKGIRTPLLVGTVILKGEDYFNSAVLFSKDGRMLAGYDKLHLVPFGEYVPLRKIFPFLSTLAPIGDFTSGQDYTVFSLGGRRFSVLICFEDVFPYLAKGFVNRGASFLVNITNDAWFKKTSSPYQHLQASVFRAVENRVNLVRCANTGFSGFIDPKGRILSRVSDNEGLSLFIAGYQSQIITFFKQNSLYTKFGDWFAFACVILSIALCLAKFEAFSYFMPLFFITLSR